MLQLDRLIKSLNLAAVLRLYNNFCYIRSSGRKYKMQNVETYELNHQVQRMLDEGSIKNNLCIY